MLVAMIDGYRAVIRPASLVAAPLLHGLSPAEAQPDGQPRDVGEQKEPGVAQGGFPSSGRPEDLIPHSILIRLRDQPALEAAPRTCSRWAPAMGRFSTLPPRPALPIRGRMVPSVRPPESSHRIRRRRWTMRREGQAAPRRGIRCRGWAHGLGPWGMPGACRHRVAVLLSHAPARSPPWRPPHRLGRTPLVGFGRQRRRSRDAGKVSLAAAGATPRCRSNVGFAQTRPCPPATPVPTGPGCPCRAEALRRRVAGPPPRGPNPA
jgi:hypothetical protein